MEDLNLLGRFKKDSIINIFDSTTTRSGRQMLENMFRNPMTEAVEINSRSRMFRYYADLQLDFPFDEQQVESVEYFLNLNGGENSTSAAMGIYLCKFKQIFANDKNYEKLQESIIVLADMIVRMSAFLADFPVENCPVKAEIDNFNTVFSAQMLNQVKKIAAMKGKLTLGQTVKADRLFRVRLRDGIDRMMALVAELDVCVSVGNAARTRGYGFAEAVESESRFVDIKGVWHPSLLKPVANDIRIDSEHNVFFLTGVNMAGKSTFMKAVSIAYYLAQMGFPVPAEAMEFTPVEGIYTSINVPDDISQGYSHFYAEVLRVKGIAERVAEGRNLFIIFDELFKGTNVKDAYDATLAVTDAYASHRNCLYIISTHIVEVGPALAEKCGNVQFRFLAAQMAGNRLVYPYKLAEGISADRHGMTIIMNERILDIIRGEAVNDIQS